MTNTAGHTGRDDGGPAFPTLETETLHPQWGMSLRDYFAASALRLMECHGWPADADAPEIARRVYMIADAMLEARAKATS